ncbi:MAG: right-handed parallel beta-helix repeat-containing protein [Candidatus Bathyarchaeota archaeon]|nr:right-handed parallel beta-helix repeat-containing protein [Candidatus Termiticorpusculum sp.]
MVTQSNVRLASNHLLPTLVLLLMLLLLLCIFNLDFVNAGHPFAKEGIRITPKGVVEGTDKIRQNGNVYTLTEDIAGDVKNGVVFIKIERSGIIFDGAGKTIRGTGGGIAIELDEISDITIKNTNIVNFGTSIELCNLDSYPMYTSNIQIVDNYFEFKYWAIKSSRINQFVIVGNTFVSTGDALNFGNCVDVTFTNNKFVGCGLSIVPDVSDIFYGNTIEGKPIVFLIGQSDQVINGAGQVILVNCTNIIIQNVDAVGIRRSIQLFGTSHTKVVNCILDSIVLTNSNDNLIANSKVTAGIVLVNSNGNLIVNNELSKTGGTWQVAVVGLYSSSNNMVSQNLITGTSCCGIAIMDGSEYNRVEKNDISSSGVNNMCAGIALGNILRGGGKYNYIYENNISTEDFGISFSDAEYNMIFKNNIYEGRYSVDMGGSMFNDVFGNTFSGASIYAVYLDRSDFNNFFWNSFNTNTDVYEIRTDIFRLMNATYYSEHNKWDNGKEGNYWSDYTGQDNGAGVGKTFYQVYDNFIDNYPLIQPYDVDKIQVTFTGWKELSIDTQIPDNNHFQLFENFSLILSALTVVSVVAIIGVVAYRYVSKRSLNQK